MKISINNLMSALEKTNSFPVRPINLGLSDVNNFRVLEEFRIVESWLNTQDNWRTSFDS